MGGSQQPNCPTCVMQCIQGTFWLCLEVVKSSFAPSHSKCVYRLSQVAGMAGSHMGHLEKTRFLVSLVALSGFRQEGKELLFAIGDLEERVLGVSLLP